MIILAYKPTWWTSNDLVQYVKHQLHAKKCGHAGTLDPMATGLMILATDDDTKKLHTLTGCDKTYTATVDLSALSDTRDAQYRDFFEQYPTTQEWLLIHWVQKPWPTKEVIETLLQGLYKDGWYVLPIPPFSAKKVGGKKRYDMARSWDQAIVDQFMSINNIVISSYQAPLLTIQCDVGSWTYIRSIAYWLGQQLWTGWILTALERTSIGNFSLDQIKDIDPNSKIPYQAINPTLN